MSSIKYRPEIDGLRALAVIPVILFHFGVKGIGGGFVGVDVFFVISGYLISLIILKEHDQGTFTLRNFWLRRARRILPALSSVILASMIAGYFILFSFDWKALAEQGLSVFALIANFKMWKLASDYWAASAHETPLLHTWSLAVEEQFYLFYPLLLVTILKFARKHAFKLILAITVASFVCGVILTRRESGAAFYLLPSRAWELAAGCLLAILTYARPARFSHMRHAPEFSCIGILLISLSYLYISEERGFPGYQALFPVLGTLMILAFTSEKCLPGRALASPPVCYVGRISYSLYLWHWPVIVFANILRKQSEMHITHFMTVVVILALSIASYHWIEKPARFSKKWAIPVFALTLGGIAAAAGMYLARPNLDFSVYEPVVWKGNLYNVNPGKPASPGEPSGRMKGIVTPWPEAYEPRAFAEKGIFKAYHGPSPEVVVFGDSHALMWSSTIDSICKELEYSVSFFSADATQPFISDPPQKTATFYFNAEEKFLFDTARLRVLKEHKPKVVILSCRFYRNTEKFDELLTIIHRSGARCLIIEQPPLLPFGDKNALAYAAELAGKRGNPDLPIHLPLGDLKIWRRGRPVIETWAKTRPGVRVVEIADLYLADPKHVCLMENRRIQYIDDDHLSDYGASKAKSRLLEAIRDSVQPPK